ncbi:MAG TPA: hypothetical protein VH351_09955 [Bryobacteraceae bacterium]|jgi:hypothetical protein|nr:hypothetical protein [Bryobacteraceae bacterium]
MDFPHCFDGDQRCPERLIWFDIAYESAVVVGTLPFHSAEKNTNARLVASHIVGRNGIVAFSAAKHKFHPMYIT